MIERALSIHIQVKVFMNTRRLEPATARRPSSHTPLMATRRIALPPVETRRDPSIPRAVMLIHLSTPTPRTHCERNARNASICETTAASPGHVPVLSLGCDEEEPAPWAPGGSRDSSIAISIAYCWRCMMNGLPNSTPSICAAAMALRAGDGVCEKSGRGGVAPTRHSRSAARNPRARARPTATHARRQRA